MFIRLGLPTTEMKDSLDLHQQHPFSALMVYYLYNMISYSILKLESLILFMMDIFSATASQCISRM